MKCTVLVTLPSRCGIVHTWLTTPRWIVQFSGSMSGLPTLQHFLWWRVGCNPLHRIFARKWWVRMCRGNWNGVLTSWFCLRLWKSRKSWHPSGLVVIAWWQVGSWWNLHSLSPSALELRMLAEWASQPWTMIRSPDISDEKGKGLFSWVSFLKQGCTIRTRTACQVHQVQWKNEWQEHLREAMTLLKSGYGESLLWPELPQRGSTMSARTFTFGISWHILSSMASLFFPASRLDALYSDFSQGYDAYEQRKRGDGCESEEQVRNQDEAWCDMMQPCEFAGHHTKDVNCPAGASKPIFLAQCVRLSTHAWLDCHARPGLIGFPTRVGFRT